MAVQLSQVSVIDTATGAGFGIVANQAWLNITGGTDPVPGIEHHHWGLLSLLAASRNPKFAGVLLGFGGTLIVQKFTYPDPLGEDEPPAAKTLNYGLTSLLVGLNLMAWSPARPS